MDGQSCAWAVTGIVALDGARTESLARNDKPWVFTCSSLSLISLSIFPIAYHVHLVECFNRVNTLEQLLMRHIITWLDIRFMLVDGVEINREG